MTNNSTTSLIASIGLISSLLAFSCQAETTQPASASQKSLTYESSLSDFKSINNDTDNLSASDPVNEIKDMPTMDHSKMGADEMRDMDHSKMGADEMRDMDHSKMSPEGMKNMEAAPKKPGKPSKVKKLKPMKPSTEPMPANEAEPTAPAEANPHQNHQM